MRPATSFAAFLAATTLLLSAGRAYAADYARFLLPVHVPNAEIIGASAARWRTELVVVNTSTEPVVLGPCAPGFPENPHSSCPPAILSFRAESVLTNPIVGWTEAGAHGRFVWMLVPRAADVRFDLSVLRNDVQLAKLPVVSAEEFTAAPLYLLNIPHGASTRATLRIYGLDNAADTGVRVRIATMPDAEGGAVTLGRTTVALQQSPYVDPAGLPYAPSYAEVALETLLQPHQGSITIELESLDGASKIWAFVTVNGSGPDRLVVVRPFTR